MVGVPFRLIGDFMTVWKTGDTITADKLNALEKRADDAATLSTTNESDIGDIYNRVNAVISDSSPVSLVAGCVKGSNIASKAVTAGKIAAGAVNMSKLGSDVQEAMNSGGASVQTGTVVDTFANLKVGHIPTYVGGDIRSGVIELTNGGGEPLEIANNTAFVTGLQLRPSMTFLVVDIKSAEPYTFEASESGAAMMCTTAITVPANSSLYLMVVE